MIIDTLCCDPPTSSQYLIWAVHRLAGWIYEADSMQSVGVECFKVLNVPIVIRQSSHHKFDTMPATAAANPSQMP